jgi:hypothetical protein
MRVGHEPDQEERFLREGLRRIHPGSSVAWGDAEREIFANLDRVFANLEDALLSFPKILSGLGFAS